MFLLEIAIYCRRLQNQAVNLKVNKYWTNIIGDDEFLLIYIELSNITSFITTDIKIYILYKFIALNVTLFYFLLTMSLLEIIKFKMRK